MTATPADVAYATYMLKWIESLAWPPLAIADETLPALRAYWTESADIDLDGINERLWAWVDANGGARPSPDKAMILARMLICLAAVPNRELEDIGYFEDLLSLYGLPRQRHQGASADAIAVPTAQPERADSAIPAGKHEQLKTQVLWAFAVISLVSGAHAASAGVTEVARAVELGLVFVMITLIFLWYRIDADQHGFKRTVLWDIGIVSMAAFVVPFYLMRSRNPPQGQIAVLKAVLVFLGSIVLSAIGALIFGQPPG